MIVPYSLSWKPPTPVTPVSSTTLLSLPNELLLLVAENCDHPGEVNSLIQTSHRLALLLTPLLHKLALEEKHGSPALHWAAARGYGPLVRLVLENGGGGDVNGRDWMGRTPLHQAMECCHTETIILLLAKGADPSLLDMAGCTPLHIAVRRVKFFNNKQVSIGQLRHNDSQVQATKLQEIAVKLLFKHKADPNVINREGDSPLHYAARACLYGIGYKLLKSLLDNGADPLLEDRRQCRPSHYLMGWPQAYRMVKRREWKRDKGYVYASILCITGAFPYTKYRKHTFIKFLYGKDCNP